MPVIAPPVRRRLLGKALRGHREARGYTLADVARILECDRSKLSRIETGARGIRDGELRELLLEYGVADDQQTMLRLLGDPRSAFGWYRDYDQVLTGAWADYLILETAASKILAYEAQRIPGLLQTPAYARALADMNPALKDDAARCGAVEAVKTRQQVILDPGGPEVHVIIGQAALHQQVGSRAVMDEQLRALASIPADSGSLTVQIVTFDSGVHAAAGEGSVSILRFGQTPRLGLVHLGGISGGVCLENPADLETYTGVFEHLRAFAQGPQKSALLLQGLAGAAHR